MLMDGHSFYSKGKVCCLHQNSHTTTSLKKTELVIEMKLEERKCITQASPLCSEVCFHKIGSFPGVWIFNCPLICIFWCGVWNRPISQLKNLFICLRRQNKGFVENTGCLITEYTSVSK